MTGAEYDGRTTRLVRARRDSAARKQEAAVDAVLALQRGGYPVTFTAVARAAHVSTWFTYNNAAVRTATEQAMAGNIAELGPSARAPDNDTRSQQGLRVDLAGARAEICALRDERVRLNERLQRTLGSHLDAVMQSDTAHRVAELTAENLALIHELARTRAELARASEQIDALNTDLTGARAGLRRMMRELPLI